MAAQWVKLDNAAKIFPPTIDKRDKKVFRFSCELSDSIEKELLSKALSDTLKLFPLYSSTLKRGFFWYYLEISNLKPEVSEEHNPPCSPLYDKSSKGLLFDVSFYKQRINLEVFHALSDGSGALQFFKALIYKYLKLKYKIESMPPLDYDASLVQKIEDSFQKNYMPGKKLEGKKTKAYQLHSNYLPEKRLSIITGGMSVKAALAGAKAHGATMTVYLTAVLIKAINSEMPLRHKNKPIVIAVPVNLRNYFNSATARNFFSIIHVNYNFGESSGDFDDIVEQLKVQFSDKLAVEQLSRRMNGLTSLEHNIFARIIPLQLKDFVLRIANGVNKREITCTLSNLGIIKMPTALQQFVRSFDVFNSTGSMHICLVSYGERMSISFSSAFANYEIQKYFFRFLAKEGMEIEITSNILNYENEDAEQ